MVAGLQPKLGQKRREREGKREKVLFFSKGTQTIEFKYRFEFNQTRIMQQHVCNKHQATCLV
jgi:hypothetical protein